MQFRDLSRRLFYSMLILPIIVVVLIWANFFFIKTFIVILIAVLGAIGIWEYTRLVSIKDHKQYIILVIVLAICLILSFFLSVMGQMWTYSPLMMLALSVLCLFVYHFNKIKQAPLLIALGFFGLFYIAVPLGLLLKILYISFPSQNGRFWIFYLLGVTKITDIAAYFGGRIWGEKKLAARLSPSKTQVGAVIGFIAAIALSLAFWGTSFLFSYFSLTFIQSLYLGALLGFLGQLGDLAESLLKRDGGYKNSNTIPGLGGVLDMLDSLLFTIPVIYFFLYRH